MEDGKIQCPPYWCKMKIKYLKTSCKKENKPCGGSLVYLIEICNNEIGKLGWTSVVIQHRKS